MNHRARKRFGQNFLHDPIVVQRIVAAINPQPGEHLVEIGPGLGALTCRLLPIIGTMDAIELDRDLIPRLAQACGQLGQLHIHAADALKFDFRSLVQHEQPLRLIGNLPYNISTPLLFHLLDQADAIRDMHFMLQKEVVERMVAPPGGGDYGRLSVMIQYRCRVQKLFTVGPGAFRPAPKVDSAIVRLVPHAQPPVRLLDETMFKHLVTQAFAQRRKTLRNSLKGLLTEAEIKEAGIDPQQRPERPSLIEFGVLSDMAAKKARDEIPRTETASET